MISRKFLLTGVVVGAAGMAILAADKKVPFKSLPAVVQRAVEDQTKGATRVGFVEERENGKILYEAETKVNGRTRDLMFDASGGLVALEEEVGQDTLPAAVQSALSARGKVLKVERVTKGGTVTYEAEVQKNGKTSEVAVDAQGNPIKA